MIIYGANSHGKVIYFLLEELKIPISNVIDDNELILKFINHNVNNYDSIHSHNEKLIIAIGDNKNRKKVSLRVNNPFATLISPKSIVHKYCNINDGTVILDGSIVQFGVTIGKHVILNTSCSVDHECKIDDYVHISPGAKLAGNIEVGEGTHIGTNATIIPNIKIGKWCTIGAGSVIIKDIPDFAVVVGNPGRVIRFNQIDD